MAINANSDVQVWATAISTNSETGRKIIFRFAKELNPTFSKRSQPDRIIIAWKYHSENGQPVSEEHQMMNRMEDALEMVLDHDGLAIIALVSTGEDLREWIYYAKSRDEFLERLNLALVDMPEFPIEIHMALDPEWEFYEEFRAGVKVRETVN